MRKTKRRVLYVFAALLGVVFVLACLAGFAACGGSSEEEHVHTWDAGEVTTAATCEGAGVRTYTCTECGETKTETIPATGHTWDDGTMTKEATTEADGEMTYTCTVCGATRTEKIDKRTDTGDEGGDEGGDEPGGDVDPGTGTDPDPEPEPAPEESTKVGTANELVAALAEGGEIALTNNITSSSALTVSAETEIDLGGYTLTGTGCDTITVSSGATLTVTDSSSDGSGVVDVTTHQKAALVNEGTVTLEGGTFKRSQEASTSSSANGGNSYYTVVNHGTMTIEEGATIFNKGEFSSNLENGWASNAPENASATLTINGGKIYGGKYAIKNDSCGTLYIYGGTIGGARGEEDTMPYRALLNWNEAYIYGGTLLGGNGNDSMVDEDYYGDGFAIYNTASENSYESGKLVIGKDVEELEAGETEDASGSSHDPEIWYEGQGNGTSGSGWGEVIYMDGGTVTVNSGRVWGKETKCGYGASGIGVDGGTLTVNGGVISGAASIEIWAGSVTINGGDIAEPIDLYTSVAGCTGTLTFGTGIEDKFTVTMYDEDWDETNCENSAYCIEYTQKTECELNGHVLVGTYDSSSQQWTYACSVCEDSIDLTTDADDIASLTLIADDATSLSAACTWNEIENMSLTIDVVTTNANQGTITVSAILGVRYGEKTIILNADIDMTEKVFIVLTTVELDLNGHSIYRGDSYSSSEGVVRVGQLNGGNGAYEYGDLTVKDSSEGETGKISGQYGVVVLGGSNNDGFVSSFTLVSGTIEGSVIAISTNGSTEWGAEKITIQGGTVKGTGETSFGIYLPSGELVVTGGSISGVTGIEIKAGSVSITGGTISTTVEGGTTNVEKKSGSTDTYGYAIGIIDGASEGSYKALTSVTIGSGVTLSGDIYVDSSVGNTVVNIDTSLEDKVVKDTGDTEPDDEEP